VSEGDGSVDGLRRPNLPHVHIGVPWGDGLERRLPGARYGIVLLLLLATYIFRASAPTGDWVPLVTVILQGATLLAALAAAKSAPIFAKIAVVVIALGLVGGVLTLFSNTASDRGYVAGLSFLLVVVAPVAIALSIWRRPEIDIQTVLGAICIYILLGMAFAFVFTATGDLGSGPFFTEQTSASTADYQYFSFVTLTTTGYGDLTAAQGFGRAMASIEGLTGQLYLVTIVALLVSQLGFRRRDRGSTD
jgi:Ion channel